MNPRKNFRRYWWIKPIVTLSQRTSIHLWYSWRDHSLWKYLWETHAFYMDFTFLCCLSDNFSWIFSVFDGKSVLTLSETLWLPCYLMSPSTTVGGQLWEEIAVNFLTLFISFLQSCLSAICPSSPRISSHLCHPLFAPIILYEMEILSEACRSSS